MKKNFLIEDIIIKARKDYNWSSIQWKQPTQKYRSQTHIETSQGRTLSKTGF